MTATAEQTEAVDTQTTEDETPDAAEQSIKDKLDKFEARDNPPVADEEAEDTVEEEASTEPEAGEVEFELDEDLLDRAEDMGLTRSQARKMGEQLEDVVSQLERRAERASRKRNTDTEGETAETTSDPFKVSLSVEDGFEPEMVAEVQRLADHFQNELAAIRKELSSKSQEAQQASFENRVHQLIAEREDRWADVLGKGTSPNRSESRKRQDVMRRMRVIQDGLKSNKLKPLPEGELLDQALSSLYPEHLQTLATKERNAKSRKRASQQINRPGGNRSAPVRKTGEEGVIAEVEKMWNKLTEKV